MSSLESRYRRLLALYPADHRHQFGDEMLGVLMSNAGDRQRRPRFGESVDLMWHALWRRIGRAVRPRAHGHWSLAASVVGVVGSLSLFAMHLRLVAGEQAWQIHHSIPAWHSPDGSVLAGAVAGLLTLAVLFGPRGLVIPAAWGAVLAEGYAAYMSPRFNLGDSVVVGVWAPLLLMLTTAVALSLRQPARAGLRLLGGRGVIALVAIALAVSSSMAVEAMLTRVNRVDKWLYVTALPFGTDVRQAFLALMMVAGMAVLWWRLDGPVRRRAIVMLVPSGVLFLIGLRIGGFPVDYPEAWVTLTLIVTFVVLCLVLVKWWERMMHLVELGRQAERAAASAARDETTPAAD
ncbi:hypothetical protein [Allorhizocola rhizosphaerae]|uniref:hypothetical protein n=1 Tax=Allorhizocola rhizosphaerae TaxID=1872709 RepID=UPI000E3B8386|nr:hypothetical protein [Allorhizocola rhizosphaerae]